MDLFNKNEDQEPDITSPSATDNEPLKNFIFLASVIITTPVIFLISLFRGRIRNPFIIVGFLLLIIYGLYSLSNTKVPSKRDLKTKIIQETLEELTPEEKESLSKEISTLRESIDADKIPAVLEPIIDVPVDMLTINYLLFMIQSGYIKANGEGSEFILDSYLHSNHKLLREKSWEALQNIHSEASERVMQNYNIEVRKRQEELISKYGSHPHDNDGIMNDLKFNVKNKIQEIRN